MAPAATVTGAVVISTNEVIPPDASLIVQIQDVTVEGVIGVPIAEAILPASDIVAGRAEFSVAYDPALLVESNAYAIVARIDTADARTILATIEPALVINDGAPTEGVEIALLPLPQPAATPAAASAAPAASVAPAASASPAA
jgi:uncharacterized lipoprotein YbaY